VDVLGIEVLEIDPHIEEKLWAKHGLLFGDVEDVLQDEDAVVEHTGEGTHEVYGRTGQGAVVLVSLVRKGEGVFKVVTAFPVGPRRLRWFENRRGRR